MGEGGGRSNGGGEGLGGGGGGGGMGITIVLTFSFHISKNIYLQSFELMLPLRISEQLVIRFDLNKKE